LILSFFFNFYSHDEHAVALYRTTLGRARWAIRSRSHVAYPSRSASGTGSIPVGAG